MSSDEGKNVCYIETVHATYVSHGTRHVPTERRLQCSGVQISLRHTFDTDEQVTCLRCIARRGKIGG